MYSFENLIFFRGASANYDRFTCSVNRVRKNRQPRDTQLHLHAAADDWFLRKFGIRFRSQALLLSSMQSTATAYAASPESVFRVLPLDGYTYCWSPNVADMLQLIDATTTPENLCQKLETANYRIEDLKSAHDSGNEVMLVCEEYLAIPIALLGYATVSPLIIVQSPKIG